MDLRPELLPPPVAAERIAALSQDIERICDLLERSSPETAAAAAAVADFNAATGHDYGLGAFCRYWESRNVEQFALEAARPAWPRIPDITRAELIEITQRVLNGAADPDADYYLLLLRVNVPYPAVGGLIFGQPELTAEEIVDKALARRPIAL